METKHLCVFRKTFSKCYRRYYDLISKFLLLWYSVLFTVESLSLLYLLFIFIVLGDDALII